MKLYECQKCGADIPVQDFQPGTEIVCDNCRSVSIVSAPVPVSTVTRLLAYLFNVIWYAGLAAFIVAIVIMIFIGNKNFWYDMGFKARVALPVEVVIERPQRVDVGFIAAGVQHVLLQGYERPSVNRLVPPNPTYWYVFALAWGSIILWIIYEIRSLVTSVRRGRPFSPRNPNRIRRIALAVFVYIVIVNLSNYWIYKVYSDYIEIAGARIEGPLISYHPELIIVGITLFVIAYVFDWGRRLQTEYDRTV